MRTQARACALGIAGAFALTALAGRAVRAQAAVHAEDAVHGDASAAATTPPPQGPVRPASAGDGAGQTPLGQAGPAGTTPSGVAPSDHALLDRLIRESRVDTQDTAPFSAYVERVRDAVLSAIGLSLDRSGIGRPILSLIPLLIVILVVVILVVILGGLLYALWRSKQRPHLPVLTSSAITLDDETTRNLREEADQLLAQGALREALAVLWRWLASELSAKGLGRTGPEVTRQEFVRSVRRTRPDWERLPELAALARTADLLSYGSARVTDSGIRALVPAAESLLQ